jgi:hypothetical protein
MVSLSEIVQAHVGASWKFLGPTSKRECCFTYAARVKSLIRDAGTGCGKLTSFFYMNIPI